MKTKVFQKQLNVIIYYFQLILIILCGYFKITRMEIMEVTNKNMYLKVAKKNHQGN